MAHRLVRKAIIHIPVEGQEKPVPYTDTHWVIEDASGFPRGFMHVEYGHISKIDNGEHVADPMKAARDFYGDYPAALSAAHEGERIRLVHDDALDHLLAVHTGRIPLGQLPLPVNHPVEESTTHEDRAEAGEQRVHPAE